MEEDFDLHHKQERFKFVFWLYNFVALAIEDNKHLRNTKQSVAKLRVDVKRMNLKALTS